MGRHDQRRPSIDSGVRHVLLVTVIGFNILGMHCAASRQNLQVAAADLCSDLNLCRFLPIKGQVLEGIDLTIRRGEIGLVGKPDATNRCSRSHLATVPRSTRQDHREIRFKGEDTSG
jgi:hypothetical protein